MTYVPSPAGFWKRYVAYFIDFVIVYVCVEILSTLYFSFQAYSQIDLLKNTLDSLMAANMRGETPDPTLLIETIETVLLPSLIFSSTMYFIIAGTYFSVMESSQRQATFGKRALGIKVTNVDGKPISLQQAVGRFVAASLSWITLNLGHALVAWTPEHRALHDYLAGSRVENADPKNPRMPMWGWLVVAAHGLLFIGSCGLMIFLFWLMLQQISAI